MGHIQFRMKRSGDVLALGADGSVGLWFAKLGPQFSEERFDDDKRALERLGFDVNIDAGGQRLF